MPEKASLIQLQKEDVPAELGPFQKDLLQVCRDRCDHIAGTDRKGQRYLNALAGLPRVTPSLLELDRDWVRIGETHDLSGEERLLLHDALMACAPWRKGPFELFDIRIDSEWVSSLKWDRVKDVMAPLAGRRILDVGSSNGYYMFRMAAHNPRFVLGIEPYLTFFFQFQLLQHFARVPELQTLPLKFEELPAMDEAFDSVFCMGILYHRRSPFDFIAALRRFLRPGGELVLETLVLPGDGDMALCPTGRYAKMNNVYFIPTVSSLKFWLERNGFEKVRCVDVTPTTEAEQRKTPWVPTESLSDFLDPLDKGKTVEGYPAPVRAIFLAEAKMGFAS